jgi:hypothetical protein
MTPPPRFPLPVTLTLFAACFAIIAWPWLSGAVTIPWDAKAQSQPQLAFLASSLARGESPLWTPNVFAGWPQIADPQSLLFSPLHLLAAVLDPAMHFRTADAASFVALFLGGTGMLLYIRDRSWSAAAAIVGALAFAFGGSAAARLQHTNEILSLSYLPLAMWLTARALARASFRLGIAAGLVCGLMAADRDQVALLALYLLAALTSVHVLKNRAERRHAGIGPIAGLLLAGTSVAALPVLLTGLLAADSNRPEILYAAAATGSLHPAHLLTFAFPDLYGTNSAASAYWGPPSPPWGPTGLILARNMGELYAGAVPLVALLGFGLLRGWLWAPEIRFFSIALCVAVLYAVGRYTPVFHAIYQLIPGVALFRRPADATFLIGALVAVNCTYLIDRFLSGSGRENTPGWKPATALGLGLVAAAAGVAASVGKVAAAVVPIAVGLCWAIAAVAALARARRAKTSFGAATLVAVLLTGDLAWNNGPNPSTGLPPALYDALRPGTANETIAAMENRLRTPGERDRRDRVELIGLGYHWPNVSLVHGFDHVFGQNPLRLRTFMEATAVGDTVAVPSQRIFSPLYPSYRSPFADLLGVRVIATGVPVEQIDAALKPGDLNFVARTQDAYIYENPRALPRVMMMTHWQLADFQEMVRSGWPPDVDPQRTLLLDRRPSIQASSGPGGAARIREYRNTLVVVEIDAPVPGFLLLTDVWHPWWRVRVDGTPRPLLRADVLFRAVQIDRGRHEVRFEFDPFSGAAAALAAKMTLRH